MREVEIDTKFKKYKETKPLSRRRVYTFYAIVLALLIFTIITKNKFLLFLFLTALCAVINYDTDMMTVRVTTAPHLFASLFITHIMGLQYGLLLLLLTTFFIHIYTGRLDFDTLISFAANCLSNVIMAFFGFIDFVLLGLIIVSFKFLCCLAINMMLDTSPQEILFEHVSGFISNIFLFLLFGNLLVSLF